MVEKPAKQYLKKLAPAKFSIHKQKNEGCNWRILKKSRELMELAKQISTADFLDTKNGMGLNIPGKNPRDEPKNC